MKGELMRRLDEVEHDIQNTKMDIEDAEGRLAEFEDERIQIEDYEAEQSECPFCEGSGWIACPYDIDPEEWDYNCPDCGGSGEK
jgi:Zn finger protein HypA/HybF involved in hydrogenase expression